MAVHICHQNVATWSGCDHRGCHTDRLRTMGACSQVCLHRGTHFRSFQPDHDDGRINQHWLHRFHWEGVDEWIGNCHNFHCDEDGPDRRLASYEIHDSERHSLHRCLETLLVRLLPRRCDEGVQKPGQQRPLQLQPKMGCYYRHRWYPMTEETLLLSWLAGSDCVYPLFD